MVLCRFDDIVVRAGECPDSDFVVPKRGCQKVIPAKTSVSFGTKSSSLACAAQTACTLAIVLIAMAVAQESLS